MEVKTDFSHGGAWVMCRGIPAARESHAQCFLTIGEDGLGWTEVVLLMVWGGVDKPSAEGNLNLSLMEEEANGYSKP